MSSSYAARDKHSLCCDVNANKDTPNPNPNPNPNQDTSCPPYKLSTGAILNTKVDYLARKFMFSLSKFHAFDATFNHPLAFSTLIFDQEIISHNITEVLYDRIASKRLHRFWIKKGRYNIATKEHIDWTANRKASKIMPISRSNFISKWTSQTIGVGKIVKRWHHRPISLCPFCATQEEDTLHVLSCLNNDSIRLWALNCKSFCYILKQIDTCEYAISAIQRCLVQWRLHQDVTKFDHLYPPDLKAVLISQHKIGWKAFQEGLISSKWASYQQSYFKDIGSHRSASLWSSKMIKAIWNFTWHTWDVRNKQLHQTERIKQFEGRDPLVTAITREWNIGLGHLPASEFAYLLSGTLQSLLQSSLAALCRWLALIRNGRILLDPSNLIHDEFLSNYSLRNWVGIIKLKDGKPIFSTNRQDG